VVFAGGEGWLLLIQPASIDAATSKLANTFIIASLNISTGRLTRLISSWLPFCAPVGGCGSGGTRVRLSSHVLQGPRYQCRRTFLDEVGTHELVLLAGCRQQRADVARQQKPCLETR
jgi:hypothetical protein